MLSQLGLRWAALAISSPPCHILQEKTKAQRGTLTSTVSHGTHGKGLLSPKSTALHVSSSCYKFESQKEKGSMLSFLETGGSFKAGAYCQSDLVSMEAASRAACSCQPEAWWSLSPQQAPRQLSRRREDLGALLEFSPAYYLLQEFNFKGKSVSC